VNYGYPMEMPETVPVSTTMTCMRLARAYIPAQPYTALYPLPEGLRKGTIFPNLYYPYMESSRATSEEDVICTN
jgi:hypothetical protein